MRQAKFYITLSVVAIVSLSVARVVVTNTISTNGIDLGRIQQQIYDLKKENAILHEQVLELSSLSHIEDAAENHGFVESKTQVVFSSPLPIALNK